MKTWHAGEEVETQGKIIKIHGGFFYEAKVTSHSENNKLKIGTYLTIACYSHPEVAQYFGTKVFKTILD